MGESSTVVSAYTMGESNTVVSAYTMYRHLQQYCSHPSNYKNNVYIYLYDAYLTKRMN